MEGIYKLQLKIDKEALDENGHTNNVQYVKWMQDAAIAHATSTGSVELAKNIGATWVVRSHHVTYYKPAFLNEVIEIFTWVSDFRKVRSLRKYKFVKKEDGSVLAQGETEWVFVNISTGRPLPIPDDIWNLFTIIPKDKEP